MQSNIHLKEHHSGNLDWGCYNLSTLVLWIQRVEALPWKRHPPSAMQHTVQTEPPVARVEFRMNNWRARVDNGSQKLRSATQRWIERSKYTKHWLIRQQKPSSYSSKHSPNMLQKSALPKPLESNSFAPSCLSSASSYTVSWSICSAKGWLVVKNLIPIWDDLKVLL